MKTTKQYLAAIVTLCMIAAACPCMTYAAAAEHDNTGAAWESTSDITELTEANEEEAFAFSDEMEEALLLTDGAENAPEMNPGETAAWDEDEADAIPKEPAELTEELTAEDPDMVYDAEAISGIESPSQGADLPETEDVWPEENDRAVVNAGAEEIVGAPSVTVGDGVTATFDAAAGSVAFMSDGGTLWKNWITKSGFGADNIKQIWVSYDSGTVYLPEDASGIFEGLKNVTSLDLRGISSTGVINMQNMFRNCNKVEMLNISYLDTSNVENMNGMFQGCSCLTELDLSSQDVSKVRSMNNMFKGCSRLHKLSFPGTVTQMVNQVSSMFAGCKSLATIDLSSFNFSKTYNVSLMFSECESLKVMKTPINCAYNIDLPFTMYDSSGTAYTKLPKYIESSCFLTKSKTIPEGFLVGDGVTATLKNGHVTFYSDGGTLWNDWIKRSGIGADNIKSFSVGASSGTVYLPELSTHIFAECRNLTVPDLSGFNTSKVKKLPGMFYNCKSLTSLDLSGFNSSNVEIMNSLFDGCSGLTSLNLDGFITGKTTSMYRMFTNCGKLKSIKFGKVDTSHVEGLHFTFSGCKSLTSLDLSIFNTSGMDSMYNAFNGCSGLVTLNLKGWNTANVERMGSMFSGCSGLAELDLSSFDLSKLSELPGYMFSGCDNLSILVTPKKNTDANIALPHTMYDSSGKAYSKLPVLTKSIVLGKTAKAAKDYVAAHAVSGTTKKFKDVLDPKHPYYTAIYWAAEKGITKGYSDGTFGINKPCTRGHAVMFIWRMAGCPAPKSTAKSPFADVPKTHTFYKAILWAQQKGITTGYTSGAKKGKFCVNETCTRGQIMTFIWRYKGRPAPKNTVCPFRDVPKTHTYYKAILWGSQKKITNGYTSGPKKGTFGLNDSCTRGMIVKFLYNIR